jgi:maleate isomerase
MSPVRLGMLTPSSNTVVEPTTQSILAPMDSVTAHYSRFKVTEISLTAGALAQFESEPFMVAADLLADANMNAIAWNGTSAAWRGFHEDQQLCDAIQARFGVPATACMLALNFILSTRKVRRLGLVTPYIQGVQSAIVKNYASAGIECVAERHTGMKVNFEFARIDPEVVRDQVREVAAAGPEAIIIVCTNLNSAHLVESLESELGLPVYDSTSAVVWHALRIAGVDTTSIQGWGSLFDDPRLNA